MLASLTIKNVVLIDQLYIEFENGLCALTGETGAGKSILLDSLGLALGMRADSGLVRQGAEQASVIADFNLPTSSHPAFLFLKENDLESDGELVLRRSLTKEGRSKAFINDQPVSVNLLRELSETLIEVHGQFDMQNLLNPATHIQFLDEYAMLADDLTELSQFYQDHKNLLHKLQETRQKMDQAREDEEYFRKSLEDLDSLNPEKGEEEKLSSLRTKLMRREQILDSLSEAEKGIEEIQNVAGNVWRALEKLEEEGREAVQAMDRSNAEIQEVFSVLKQLSSDIENSEYSLPEIDDRLFALKAQARKHNCSIEALPKKREEISELLMVIENQDGDLSDLIRACEKAKEIYYQKAKYISQKRKKSSEKMVELVMKELLPLKLDKARFEISIEELPEENWTKNGFDKVQFLIATNPNASAGALNKIASGGELSRFTLALKVVLAEMGGVSTLVFDEVDSGVGGATAAAVGERLAVLSKCKQILVVTHSPQVAAVASHHWIVSKAGDKDLKTNITPLSKEKDRQEEIARMLSGAEVTKEARAAANKLLEASSENKAA